ncbi:branched-chain amino acid ABC transporter permease [Leekyejoonella antrihumi]|uniref:Branched-chain amino acid ABC transporter permease n=1 Tax=Leekyejoonella antrihumi TaxID=1660198 RepID=A0A563E6I5_9MICO|nr:branched-chain amino acid ABC transporter permease [Leekyejoonella antrihumi]TWP38045.1 branched-chain amino acid ABC transporter permease [Leekyejoonella antrihumi]
MSTYGHLDTDAHDVDPPGPDTRSARPAPASRTVLLRRATAPVALTAVMFLLAFTLGSTTLVTMQEVLAFAVFATATNLLLGQAGLVSFGQAVFFGIGSYTVALGWLHWQLPFWATFVLAPFVGALVAIPIGLVALRARKLYFALSTLAFSELAYQLAESRYNFTKGANGVFGPFVPTALTQPRTGYLFLLAVTVVSLLLLWKVNHSPFGLVLRAIRENRERVQALGVNVYLHQVAAFVISGAFCALAGAMFVIYSQSGYPELLDWTTSGWPVFMAVIGGMGTFLGPALGALIYQFGHDQLVLYFSDWQLVLGAVLLVIVMFWPDGLMGALARLGGVIRRWWKGRR